MADQDEIRVDDARRRAWRRLLGGVVVCVLVFVVPWHSARLQGRVVAVLFFTAIAVLFQLIRLRGKRPDELVAVKTLDTFDGKQNVSGSVVAAVVFGMLAFAVVILVLAIYL